MNWGEFLKIEWKKIFLSGFLSILFLTINRTPTEMFSIIFFYFILIGILATLILYGVYSTKYGNFFKNFFAFSSILISFVFYYLAYHNNFIFMFIPAWIIAFLISIPLSWVLNPSFQKINIILNTRLPPIFWIIITVIAFLFYLFLAMSFG